MSHNDQKTISAAINVLHAMHELMRALEADKRMSEAAMIKQDIEENYPETLRLLGIEKCATCCDWFDRGELRGEGDQKECQYCGKWAVEEEEFDNTRDYNDIPF